MLLKYLEALQASGARRIPSKDFGGIKSLLGLLGPKMLKLTTLYLDPVQTRDKHGYCE